MNRIALLREQLADIEHQRWSKWMKHLFSKSTVNPDGSVTIPKESVERWQRQVATEYSDLSHDEKESDRAEADTAMRCLHRCGYINMDENRNDDYFEDLGSD